VDCSRGFMLRSPGRKGEKYTDRLLLPLAEEHGPTPLRSDPGGGVKTAGGTRIAAHALEDRPPTTKKGDAMNLMHLF